MNKTLIATILAPIIPLAAPAQMEQYCNASLRVAQKEGDGQRRARLLFRP